jgi:hypothetical protein
MVPDGSRWFQMVPDGSRWFQIVPDGSRWFQMVPDGSRWFQMVPDGSRWFQMVPGTVNALIVNDLSRSVGFPWKGIPLGEQSETNCPKGIPFQPNGFLSEGILRIGKESYGSGEPPDYT